MRLLKATSLMGIEGDKAHPLTLEERQELARCRDSFFNFLPYWHFRNRETGEVLTFETLWPGQQQFAELMTKEPWIFALKAGKLGFTELECAYDAWVLRFGPRNARVHIFSKDHPAAQEMLRYIRFGLERLPRFMRLPPAREAGSASTTSLRLHAGWGDTRTLVAYAASPNAAIDQSAMHCHVDELSHNQFAEEQWYAIETSVAPGGSCHIVTRGAGDAVFSASLWRAAEAGVSRLVPFFAPWTARPDRDAAWREEQSNELHTHHLLRFAPETADDALAGDQTAVYIPEQIWDRCYDLTLPPLDRETPIILGVDASVSRDTFAIVAVSRHPRFRDRVAIRGCELWDPRDSGGHIPFDEIERWIHYNCGGGCPDGHPKSKPSFDCPHCRSRNFSVPGYNVVQLVYDPFQMEAMMYGLWVNVGVWADPFSQTTERLISDSVLQTLALRGHVYHNGSPALREHILNARAKLQPDQDSQLRMVKKAPDRRIDLAVAASMAVYRCLEFNL